MIVPGTWDGHRDEYVEHGVDFTVALKRSRLYRSFKQTPVHLSGEQDAHANAHRLIDNASRRGKKVRLLLARPLLNFRRVLCTFGHLVLSSIRELSQLQYSWLKFKLTQGCFHLHEREVRLFLCVR